MSERDAPHAASRRIVDAIVREVAVRRGYPRFYLLDECGRIVAWPASGQGTIDSVLQALLDLYFSQAPAERGILSELVQLEAQLHSVQVVPYGRPRRHGAHPRYALIVDRFAARSRDRSVSGELSPAP